ncbi:MAG: hypothetical protein ABI144_09730 [Gallionella sp.]|jgi:hypothetical protein
MKSNQKNLFPSINGGYGGAATVVLAVSVLSFVVTRKARVSFESPVQPSTSSTTKRKHESASLPYPFCASTCPWLILRLIYRRTNHYYIRVRGDKGIYLRQQHKDELLEHR